jgi:PAS domain S-box-containing protein
VTRDVTERRNAQAQLFFEKERAQVTLNSIGDAVISTDSLGHVAFLNEVARQLTGWSMKEAVGRPIVEVFRMINAVSREVTTDPLGTAVIQNRTMNLPSNTMLVRRDGVEIPIENSISPIRDRDGEVTGGVIVFRDVSGAREMAQRMAYLAQHDFLTGLPNRRFIEEKISQAIASANRKRVIWRCCSWIWTASNISTIPWDIRLETNSSDRSLRD